MSTSYEDKTLVCADCGGSFVWRAEDQEFHKQRGYEPPKRCKDCRRAKRERHGDSEKQGGRR